MDFDLYRAINGLAGRSDLLDAASRHLSTDLPFAAVAVVALLFLVPWRRHRLERRLGAVSATVSAALALLISQPIAEAADRVRPYLAHPRPSHLLIPASHDPSFPSDHATGAFALALAVWFYDRLAGSLLLALAALLGFARVFVGTHYPGDVLGGFAIAAAVVLLLRLPPLRRPLERFARACSRLWDSVLQHAKNRSSASGNSR